MEHVGFVRVGLYQVVVDLIIEWLLSTPSPPVPTEVSSRMMGCMALNRTEKVVVRGYVMRKGTGHLWLCE